MKTAYEMKLISDKIIEEKSNLERRAVEKYIEEIVDPAIQKAANKGSYSVVLPKNFSLPWLLVKSTIQSYGFEVISFSEARFRIEW